LIDWLSAKVPLAWQQPINDGLFVSIRADGEIEYQTDKRKMLIGSFQSHLTVRSVELGFVELSGNPVKFLQGHNLMGTDDLAGLLLATMDKVCAACGVDPSAEDRAAWLRGDVVISRLDCTAMYELESRDDVLEWLRAADQLAHVKWRGRGHYDPGTLTFGMAQKGKRAKDWQLMLYCKGLELTLPGHQLHPDLPDFRRLLDWADNKLRIELRLRTRELKRHGLLKVGDWSPEQVSRMLERYLAKVEMSEQQMVHVDIEKNLKPRHRAALALWKTGADLKSIYPRQTFYRYRKEVADACGVDIGSRANVDNVVPLRRVLEAKPVTVPAWAEACCFVPPARIRRAF
jgi:II/X family phage/plasmid replication protein